MTGTSPPGPAEPIATGTVAAAATSARSADLVLARLHLRLGSLTLARAELETLAGRDALDEAGLVDLAEARWRTGDVAGAGEAALVVLDEDGAGPLIAMVVAAEAATLRGRPSEARRYTERALAAAGASPGDAIDALFAGMPRGPVWPADATTVSLPAPTLFDAPGVRVGASATPAAPAAPLGSGDGPAGSASGDGRSVGPVGGNLPAAPPEPATIALWETIDAPAPADVDDLEPELPPGDAALHAGAAALATGDLAGAAVHLSLALRVTPALAPAVLEAIDGHRDRALAFVRGDAYRLAGRERDARRAYAQAVDPILAAGPPIGGPATGGPAADQPPADRPPEGDPA